MGKLYLSPDKITQLKNYLKSVLPAENLLIIKKLQAEHPEFDFCEDTEKNKQWYWQMLNDEVKKGKAGTKNTTEYEKAMNCFNFASAGEVVLKYIEANYKKEWQVISGGFNPTKIFHYLNSGVGFCKENYIEHIYLKDIINAGSTDDFVNRFEKKNCDPKLVEVSDRIAKYLDSVYFQKRGYTAYAIYQNAIMEYMATGEPDKLHNILNKDY